MDNMSWTNERQEAVVRSLLLLEFVLSPSSLGELPDERLQHRRLGECQTRSIVVFVCWNKRP